MEEPHIAISMDGRGRCLDNTFVEIFAARLGRSLKYEEVYLKDYQSGLGGPRGIVRYHAHTPALSRSATYSPGGSEGFQPHR